jgi:glyoxylase-like metal-dependent hydrolase (beta-lactamase superfamily II)
MPHLVSRIVAPTAFAFCCFLVVSAHAAAPTVRTQAPGYYRTMLGDFELTALSDGTLALPIAELRTNATPEKVQKTLASVSLEDPVDTLGNGYLINPGTKLVLIDTGAGALFGPTVGNLVNSLTAAAYQPEQVDEIYITHMHGVHVGGLMAGDKLVFPNATVRADKHDADDWLSQTKMEHLAFPGLCHLRAEGSGYLWIPANYSSLR